MTPDQYLAAKRRREYNRLKTLLKRSGEWPELKQEMIIALNKDMATEKRRVLQYDEYNFQRMLKGEIP
jgi:hypothetical protein